LPFFQSIFLETSRRLEYIKHTKYTTSPFTVLWETFALGASLATLLNLLEKGNLTIDVDKSDLGLGLPHREKYFTNFIQRVQLLEVQQKIPFGEVLRVRFPLFILPHNTYAVQVQDLFGGTNSGFAKVCPISYTAR
jgi:hypothetical protein